jgi:hypothetical protein
MPLERLPQSTPSFNHHHNPFNFKYPLPFLSF